MLLTACSTADDDVADRGAGRQAVVTLMVTPNGLGDNGYNDDAYRGIYAFAKATGAKLSLLTPASDNEARQLYSQWLTANALQDSAVMVLASSAYEEIARQTPVTLQGQGSRVLLFESNATIEGVTTVRISRRGASYLCGAMSADFPALVYAATKGVNTVDEAAEAFREGYDKYANDHKHIHTLYLAEGEKAFAMADSAYHYLYNYYYNRDISDIIFPLLGGSGIGAIRMLNDLNLPVGMIIGMDVDQSLLCTRIPFSMIVRIGEVLRQLLSRWNNGQPWPSTVSLGMADNVIDVVVTKDYEWSNFYEMNGQVYTTSYFEDLYKKYKDEASALDTAHASK